MNIMEQFNHISLSDVSPRAISDTFAPSSGAGGNLNNRKTPHNEETYFGRYTNRWRVARGRGSRESFAESVGGSFAQSVGGSSGCLTHPDALPRKQCERRSAQFLWQ